MSAMMEMMNEHPLASIWLAMTVGLWFVIYLSTRTKPKAKNPGRAQ